MMSRGRPIEHPEFSGRQTAAVVVIAIVAGCVPALQPILLGGLLSEGRMDAVAMGRAATAEGLGMALATAIAGAALPPRRLRLIGSAAILAVLAANFLTLVAPSPGIIAARCLSGLGNGVLLWLLVGMLARSADPTRLYALYITGNASLVFLLSLVLTTFATTRFGVMAGYGGLIGIYVPLLLIVRFAPSGYADLEGGTSGAGLPPGWGLAALFAVVLFLAGVMAFWIYSVPLGNQMGISTTSMQGIIGAATGVQIVAGLAAIALASRLTGMQVVTSTAIVGIAAMFATMLDGSVAIWLPALLAFSFCWMFGPPFHIAFLNGADPSRRTAMFVGTAQLVGVATGPLLASAAISSSDYAPARVVSLACFGSVLAIAMFLRQRGRAVAMARPVAESP